MHLILGREFTRKVEKQRRKGTGFGRGWGWRWGFRLGVAQKWELAAERKTFEYVRIIIRTDPCTYMLHTGSFSTNLQWKFNIINANRRVYAGVVVMTSFQKDMEREKRKFYCLSVVCFSSAVFLRRHQENDQTYKESFPVEFKIWKDSTLWNVNPSDTQ